MSDGRRAAWIQLTIFLVVVLAAAVVHLRGTGEFNFLLTSVFVGFLVVGVAALACMLWRARRHPGGDPES